MLKIEITFPLSADEQKALAAILASSGTEHVELVSKQATEPVTENDEMKATVEKASTQPAKRVAKKAAAPTPEPESEEEEATSDIQDKALEMAAELIKTKKTPLVREALEASGGTKVSELDDEQAQAFVDFLNDLPAEEEEKPAPAKKTAAKKTAAKKPEPEADDDLLGGEDEYTADRAMELASALVKDKQAQKVRDALTVAGASKVTELEGDQLKVFIDELQV